MVPTSIFFTSGQGCHSEKLASFEMALRDAQIAQYNLVEVSSIFPPGCKIIPPSEGIKCLSPGEITHCVLARNSTNESGRLISASVGLAIPQDKKTTGYISEIHQYGKTAEESGNYAEELAVEMLATIMDLNFHPESDFDEKKEICELSGLIVDTQHNTEFSRGTSVEGWATVISAAVFVP